MNKIHLTEQQEKEALEKKVARLKELISAAEEETGMMISAKLRVTLDGIVPAIVFLPKQ